MKLFLYDINSGSHTLAAIMVKSINISIFYSIGYLLLKHEAPLKAKYFFIFSFLSSTNSNDMLAL